MTAIKKVKPTPTEKIIYKIAVKQFEKLNRPLRNKDIASVHGSHRTNIRVHLANMVKKGLVKRYRFKFYIPL